MSEDRDQPASPIPILLVEDNQDHAILIELALSTDASPRLKVFVAHDGQEALDFLEKAANNGQGREYPMPVLILLDLNLPKVNGFEVLAHLRSDPRLKHIPVSILTTSANEADIHKAYHEGANCYLTKPPKYTDMVVKLHQLVNYILRVHKPPLAMTPT